MFIYTYIYIYIYIHNYTWSYIITNIITSVNIYIYIHRCNYIYIYTYKHNYIYMYICLCIYVCIYMYMYMYMFPRVSPMSIFRKLRLASTELIHLPQQLRSLRLGCGESNGDFESWEKSRWFVLWRLMEIWRNAKNDGHMMGILWWYNPTGKWWFIMIW